MSEDANHGDAPDQNSQTSELAKTIEGLQKQIRTVFANIKIALQNIPPGVDRDAIVAQLQKEVEPTLIQLHKIEEENPAEYKRILTSQIITSANEAKESGILKKMASVLLEGMDRTVELGYGIWADTEEIDDIKEYLKNKQVAPYHFVAFRDGWVIFPHFQKSKVIQAVFWSLYNLRKAYFALRRERYPAPEKNGAAENNHLKAEAEPENGLVSKE